MNPGLIVKLRPTGPWRIGPDSGARNRVDAIYHSDSLYSAVAHAMSRLGALDEWLDATARAAAPVVCFSSCFPFVNETPYVTPPRTVWPPNAASLTSGRVRWKSARFVPMNIVRDILSGKTLDENRWTLDGPSGCLMAGGKPGPFRTSLRWSAAIDRLSGAAERHSAACLEFRPGAGLWTVVSFAGDAVRDQWQDRVKAAFRWLADSGFGGERSRGWGRSEAPQFVEGMLPEMVLGTKMTQGPDVTPPIQEPPREEPPVIEPPTENPDVNPPEPPADPELPPPDPEPALAISTAQHLAPSLDAPLQVEPSAPNNAESPSPDPDRASTPDEPLLSAPSAESPGPVPSANHEDQPQAETPDPSADPDPAANSDEPLLSAPSAEGSGPMPSANYEDQPQVETTAPSADPDPAVSSDEPLPSETSASSPELRPPTPGPQASGPQLGGPQWLLSLFSPASADTVEWSRGNYTLIERGGRVESSAGSGALKKQLQMVSEGSVLYAGGALCGAAPDVAPEGFAHPVFRAGFALAIPLPEVS